MTEAINENDRTVVKDEIEARCGGTQHDFTDAMPSDASDPRQLVIYCRQCGEVRTVEVRR